MNFFRNPWAIILLVVLVILLFGANKLPGLARNMGKSMRIFKSEVEELRGDEKGADEDDEDDRPVRSSRPRDDADRRSREDLRDREDRPRGDDREYDPRDEADSDLDREPIRARDEDDSYRRD
ncbi:Sec-independent protein translocase subunit TatA [Brachybacterium sp. AOP43-C2-M15]|uniref:Sec-independent protein translocase subunit TatA n=1 Tax=Brachybacterium sp. AOP43-C2-M15 TaxID=3457661 RepID=UPI004034AF43